MRRLSEHLWRVADTCNVYVVAGGDSAATVDFGAGRALAALDRFGVRQIGDVLMTHYHRDQGQGLPLAVAAGARVWAPHAEQDLFARVDEHWQAREVFNNYNMRQDRFALLEPVPLAGTLRDYATYRFAGHAFSVIPTPGHTIGSVTLLAPVDGARVAFTGDLIAAPGKVWSLAATQWTYNNGEGLSSSILSLLDLKERAPDLLLPAHGEPIADPAAAIDLTVERLLELMRHRQQRADLLELRDEPYVAVTPHLLWNRASTSHSYVLLSRSGKALLFDFGYDYVPGLAAGSDRAGRRPWLYSLPRLRAQFGVERIDAVVPTHFHDDHVAGLNLLRDVEGTQVWAAESFADILECPARYNLPCLWYDPIPVDRVLPIGQPVAWEEYELTLHPLPGHTRYAVAISLEVDGERVLVTGDQYQGDGTKYNYVYQNGFQIDDYQESARLYRSLNPNVVLTGHWGPQHVQPGYFDTLDERGAALARLHREMLPEVALGLDGDDFVATIEPYQATVAAGRPVELTVTVRNPYPHPVEVELRLLAPVGWQIDDAITAVLPAAAERSFAVRVTPPSGGVRRARVAADVTLDGQPFGQHAEALISVQAEKDGDEYDLVYDGELCGAAA